MPKNTDKDNKKDDNIHIDHRKRTRQKFMKSGFAGFADHEKLEFLLYYARPRVDTNVMAHELLKKFRNLGGVFDASIDQLTDVDGVGEISAILIKIIPEMTKEYVNIKSKLTVMEDSKAVCEFFKTEFIGERNEKIKIACVDDKLRLIACEVISEGTASSAVVDIKKLISITYKYNCESIIMAHNHPNGDLMPSNEDVTITKDIYRFLKPIGIKLLDHIIVAGGQAVSLKELGAFTLLD